MRFFADRARDRPAPDAERPEPPLRSVGPAQLAAALLDRATDRATRCHTESPHAGLASVLTVLWSRIYTFDAADPAWPDRDRFVLSHPAADPLLSALLHLTVHAGVDQATPPRSGSDDTVVTPVMEDGRLLADGAFSATASHALAQGVGLALAERVLAGRFGKSLVDHRVWVLVHADALTHGVSNEAAALAGLMRLDRLVLLVDATSAAAEDARPGLLGHGWAVKTAATDDYTALEGAMSYGLRSRKPTLVWCTGATRSHAPRGAPAPVDAWQKVGVRGAANRRGWLKRITRHPQRAEFERVTAGRLGEAAPDVLGALLAQVKARVDPVSPDDLCRLGIERLSPTLPELLGARLNGVSPDPTAAGTAANMTAAKIEPTSYTGRSLCYGTRPHGMAACVNGIALHGGLLPFVTTSLADVAEQLPALRIAARLGRQVVYFATDPGLAPCRSVQPAGVLPALRAIPDLHVYRPGCAREAAECLDLALRRSNGPSLLILSREPCAVWHSGSAENRCARGGYVLAEAERPRQATLLATGAELTIATAARGRLHQAGIAVAVVSLPCWDRFAGQDDIYRKAILGDAPRFALEAGGRCGWDRWIGENGTFIGGDLPASGSADAMRQRLGLTADLVAAAVTRRLENACNGLGKPDA